MLKATLVFLLGLAASNASAQHIVRLQEPLPAVSHPVHIDTDRSLSVRHLASGETARCDESCLLQMAEGEYSLEPHEGLIRAARAIPLSVAGPEKLALHVRPRRGWRIFGAFLASTLGLGGLVAFGSAVANPCRDTSFCLQGAVMAIGGALSLIGFSVGIGLMFTRDRVEFTSAAQPAR